MTITDRLRDLARLTLRNPEQGGRALLALNPTIEARWMAMGAAITAGVVMAYLLPVLAGQAGGVISPFAATGVQAGANLLAVVLMTAVGRVFGGQGRFEDAVLLVAWLQALMVGVQAVQLVALLVLPPLAWIVTMLAVALFFWLLTGFVQALHGFRSRFLVLFGVLGSMFTAAFVVSFFLILAGFDPTGMSSGMTEGAANGI
jgi:hypothetical protein